jgi:hypothetical protein
MLAQEGATIAELMDRLGHTTPKAALVYQHAAADRDQFMAERLSGRMATPATWSLQAGQYTLNWSPDAVTGSPEIVDAIQGMADRDERVRATPTGPALTVRLTEPLSVLVASIGVIRNLGVTEAIKSEGHPPAAVGLPLDEVS